MPPFRATPAIHTVRTAAGHGLFPKPVISPFPANTAAAATATTQRNTFFLSALQQRFGSNFTSPSTPGGRAGKPRSGTSSASSAMDEMIDADIDISDPPEAVGASHAATARAAKEQRMGSGRMEDDGAEGGNKMLYASAGALGLLGLYAVFNENPDIGSSSSSGSSSPSARVNPELDPGTDARGRTSPLSSVRASRQHHDLPAHAPGGETIEFKLGRG